MEALPELGALIAALMVGLVGGFIKGLVGFALPVILVSGLSTLLSPEAALSGVVLPAILSNVWQGLRQGPASAFHSVWKFRLLLGVGLVVLVLTAQLVAKMSDRGLFLALGLPVVVFSLAQLSGWRPAIDKTNRIAEVIAGVVFGIFGGLAAMFGPALVLYLTAIGTPKTEQVRVQGVVFSLGAILFGLAHVFSGIVRWETLLFSAIICIPSLIGLGIGFRVQDKVNQATFRMLTLVVLLIAGLNLLRRALAG